MARGLHAGPSTQIKWATLLIVPAKQLLGPGGQRMLRRWRSALGCAGDCMGHPHMHVPALMRTAFVSIAVLLVDDCHCTGCHLLALATLCSKPDCAHHQQEATSAPTASTCSLRHAPHPTPCMHKPRETVAALVAWYACHCKHRHLTLNPLHLGPSPTTTGPTHPLSLHLSPSPAPTRPTPKRVLQLGSGQAAFQRAKQALQAWQHMDLGWVLTNKPAIHQGSNVCVAARLFGLWMVNPLRISWVQDEQTRTRRRLLRTSPKGEAAAHRPSLTRACCASAPCV